MDGETDLEKLIRDMHPELNPGEYVFCTLDPGADPVSLQLLGWFREREGVTVILPREQADRAGLTYSFVAAWITLNVHSALEAVGLTAVVSQALSQHGISCNMVAAYFHDHLFVPQKDAQSAFNILKGIVF
jgi:hypothetical protein